jgi:hypothetical protein
MNKWLVALVLWSASAHERSECPPLHVLRKLAARGALGEHEGACLRPTLDSAQGREHAWIQWRNALARDGVSPAVREQLTGLVASESKPDALLEAAEALIGGGLALEAAGTARGLSGRWAGPVERADRLGRLAEVEAAASPGDATVRWAQGIVAAGVQGTRRERALEACGKVASRETCSTPRPFDGVAAAPPVADELAACADVGRLWFVATWGGAYATERDCLARALDGMPPGEGRNASARLTLLLAEAHRDSEAGAIVAARVAEVLGPR